MSLFTLGAKVRRALPPTPDGVRYVEQVIISEPELQTVTVERNGVKRNYVNTVATVLCKHPDGLMYIRPVETLNWHLPRFNRVPDLDVDENGNDLLDRDPTSHKVTSIERLIEYFARWSEAHPTLARQPSGADIDAS